MTRLREFGLGPRVWFLRLSAGFLCVSLLFFAAWVFSWEFLAIFSRDSIGILLILFFCLLGVAAFVAYITKPLRRLTREMNEFSAGNLKGDIKIEGLGELGRAFVSMTSNVQGKMDDIHKLAYVDSVTQLPNRECFRKELETTIASAIADRSSGALLFVDLDGFKRVNDTMGHDLGDKLLFLFSQRIAGILRNEDLVSFGNVESDPSPLAQVPGLLRETKEALADRRAPVKKQMLARLGGDEFTVLLPQIRVETDAATVAQRIIEATNEPFEIDGAHISIGASIGIATFPRDGADYRSVVKNADLAMYKAKEDGKNRFRYFSEELNLHAKNRLRMEADLRTALNNNDQFVLFYQPKFDCKTGIVVGVEALLRWNHPQKGLLYPNDFIPIAEECGLIGGITDWVLHAACRELAMYDQFEVELSLAVNISPILMNHPEFADNVLAIIQSTGVDPARLELEITGSFHPGNMNAVQPNFTKLAERGICFAVDDFKGGVSGLLDLAELPLHIFKIDDDLVASLEDTDDKRAASIIKSLLVMAKSLNLKTVAEGVETEKQLEFLIEHGCEYVQGFHLSRPKPAPVLAEWMKIGKVENSPGQQVA